MDAQFSDREFGRAFETMMGMMLHHLPAELFYWREGNQEVDYVLRHGKNIWAIEVKWGNQCSTPWKRRLPDLRNALLPKGVVGTW